MKIIIFGFTCLSIGMMIMGASIYDVRDNIFLMLAIWCGHRILDKILLEPTARELGIPTKAVIKTLVTDWLRERDSIKHYIQKHDGASNACITCNDRITTT